MSDPYLRTASFSGYKNCQENIIKCFSNNMIELNGETDSWKCLLSNNQILQMSKEKTIIQEKINTHETILKMYKSIIYANTIEQHHIQTMCIKYEKELENLKQEELHIETKFKNKILDIY